jgi:hypothetical protein
MMHPKNQLGAARKLLTWPLRDVNRRSARPNRFDSFVPQFVSVECGSDTTRSPDGQRALIPKVRYSYSGVRSNAQWSGTLRAFLRLALQCGRAERS